VIVGSGEEPDEAKWNYLVSLGFAVESTEIVANDKADWLNRSLLFGAIAIGLFVVFFAVGGMQPTVTP
jgi:hypothetical protein